MYHVRQSLPEKRRSAELSFPRRKRNGVGRGTCVEGPGLGGPYYRPSANSPLPSKWLRLRDGGVVGTVLKLERGAGSARARSASCSARMARVCLRNWRSRPGEPMFVPGRGGATADRAQVAGPSRRSSREALRSRLSGDKPFQFLDGPFDGRLLREGLARADVAHFHGPWADFELAGGRGRAHQLGTPYVVSPHGHCSTTYSMSKNTLINDGAQPAVFSAPHDAAGRGDPLLSPGRRSIRRRSGSAIRTRWVIPPAVSTCHRSANCPGRGRRRREYPS